MLRSRLIGCAGAPVALLITGLLASGAAGAESAYRIDGADWVRSGAMESLTAPFGGPGQTTAAAVTTASLEAYSGFVEVVVSGTGQALGTQRSDAFYVYSNAAGGAITPFNDPNFYQLAIDTAPIAGSPEAPTPAAQLARQLVVYDVDGGVETTPPYVPGYRSGHDYRFVIDVARTADWAGVAAPLHFTVANGIYEDNSGAYHIELYPLAERIDGEAVLLQATEAGAGSRVTVQVTGGTPGAFVPDIEVLTAADCSAGQLDDPTSTLALLTGPVNQITGDSRFDDDGNAFVVEQVAARPDQYAAARLVGGSAAGVLSRCIVAGPDNDAWTRAQTIALNGVAAPLEGGASGFIDLPGRARWYKFSIQPDAQARVEISGLPADYDLVLFSDIAQAFDDLEAGNPSDVEGLDRLGAEFAPSVLDTAEISPFAFSPSEVSPFAFSPFAFSPFAFSPSVFAGESVAPFAFSPFAFSPSATARSDYSPFAFSPFAFSPFAFSPFAFSAENYSSAQTRSVIAVSAQSGRTTEAISALTWSNTGEFYVRVSGKNGAFDDQTPFSIDVTYDPGLCEGVFPEDLTGISGAPGNYRTIVLYDSRQLQLGGYPAAQQAPLVARLEALAARAEVQGVVVDLADVDEVQRLHDQADVRSTCPYAANLTAQAIKRVIDAYRQLNPELAYVVLAGSDGQIPFFRYPDQTLLGPEQNYDPPMADFTQSQAALRRNYVLGQDEYGAATTLNLGNRRFPIPDLAVGRLVETPAEMITVLDAYLATADGVVRTPTSTLVTGYDFLADAANAIQAELVAGVGGRNDTLITPAQFSPEAPESWDADALRSALLGNREDIIFLAGHFNAFSALAADFQTSMVSSELINANLDLTNALVFSAGCHSGYNAVNGEIRQGVSLPPDWAQAFARKGATLVAGTGYQYGDTEFIEFGERLYLEFVRRLRTGSGPVAVGQALVEAKKRYLRETPDNKGLHPKTVLISTVFGLPMLRIDLPGSRLNDPADAPVVQNYGPVSTGPGATLGLQTATLPLSFGNRFREASVALSDLSDPSLASTVTATYLRGPGFDLSINPGEPVLPLERLNVSVPQLSLRGVGFRGGDWSEEFPVTPLDGAATTELRAPHTRFASLVNFPMRLAVPNYYGRLSGAGSTTLHVTPVQHRVPDIGGPAVRRRFDSLDLELFYSDNTVTYGSNRPALSAAPTLTGVQVRAEGGDIVFEAIAVGDPAAGIQSVWVTYTDGSGESGTWLAFDLVQDPTDFRVWRGTLPGAAGQFGRLDVVFHAVNGVGLVSSDDNFGSYYQPSDGQAEPAGTVMAFFGPAPGGGVAGTSVPVAAVLETETGAPVSDVSVLFRLGSTLRSARTDSAGVASIDLPVRGVPSAGPYLLVASFPGTSALAPSSVETPFLLQKSDSRLTLVAEGARVRIDGVESGLVAALTAADPAATPLQLRTVYFTVKGTPEGDLTIPVATDFQGLARLGELALPAGTYPVQARFLGNVPGAAEPIVDPVYLPAFASTNLDLLNGEGCPPETARSNGKAKGGHVHSVGFCYLTSDVRGNVDAVDGTLVVGGGVAVEGHVRQHGPGGITLLTAAEVRGHADETHSGDVVVHGHLGGHVREVGSGAVRVEPGGEVDKSVHEKDAGSVVVAGTVQRDVREEDAGDVIVQASGVVGGSVDERGEGSVIIEGFVGGRVRERDGGSTSVSGAALGGIDGSS